MFMPRVFGQEHPGLALMYVWFQQHTSTDVQRLETSYVLIGVLFIKYCLFWQVPILLFLAETQSMC